MYTPKHAADLLGISVSAVRQYTNTYSRHLSTEATGNPRRLTEADLRMIAYIVSKTATGQAHERVLAHLATDEGQSEYESFEWESPEGDVEANTALVPVAALQAAQALMQDAQRREQVAREQAQQRERELEEHIRKLERELGKAESTQILYEDARRREQEAQERTEQLQSELAAIKASKPKGFWARLFGGGE